MHLNTVKSKTAGKVLVGPSGLLCDTCCETTVDFCDIPGTRPPTLTIVTGALCSGVTAGTYALTDAGPPSAFEAATGFAISCVEPPTLPWCWMWWHALTPSGTPAVYRYIVYAVGAGGDDSVPLILTATEGAATIGCTCKGDARNLFFTGWPGLPGDYNGTPDYQVSTP